MVIGLPGWCSVSLVSVCFSFRVAPISPTSSLDTGSRFFPSMMNSWFSTSVSPLREFTSLSFNFTSPDFTLKKVIWPRLGWKRVLKIKRAVGALDSLIRRSPSTVCSGLRSAAAGATLSMKPINLPLPISFRADTQNTGNRSWLSMPALIPCRISSSLRVPLSKKSSISSSSFSAAFSTNSLCN